MTCITDNFSPDELEEFLELFRSHLTRSTDSVLTSRIQADSSTVAFDVNQSDALPRNASRHSEAEQLGLDFSVGAPKRRAKALGFTGGCVPPHEYGDAIPPYALTEEQSRSSFLDESICIHPDWYTFYGMIYAGENLVKSLVRWLGSYDLFASGYEKLSYTHWHHSRQWSYQYRFPRYSGLALHVHQSVDENGQEVYAWTLDVPGEACSSISLRSHFEFCTRIRRLYGAYKLTRTDLAIDDYKREIDFDVFLKAARNGQCKGVRVDRRCGARGNGKKASIKQHHSYICNSDFPTIHLGSSSSDAQLRLYDAQSKHKNINATRLEVQCRGNWAKMFWQQFAQYGDVYPGDSEYARFLLNFALSVKDFRYRVKKGQFYGHSHRVDWWQKFIDRCGVSAVRGALPQRKSTLKKTLDWLRRQVFPTLWNIRRLMGNDLFATWLLQEIRQVIDPERFSQIQKHYDAVLLTWVYEICDSPDMVALPEW